MQLVVDNSKSIRFQILERMQDGKEYEFWFMVRNIRPLSEAISVIQQLIKDDVIRTRSFEVLLPGYLTNSTQTVTYYRLSPLYNIPIELPKQLRPLKIV